MLLLKEKAEWRSVALLVACYLALGIVVFDSVDLPLWLKAIFLIPLITLHSSLQHEYMHGHPFTSQRLNDLLVWAPVGIFLPYYRFKEAHLKHHMDSRICDPLEDPESWYLSSGEWAQKPDWVKKLLEANNTLVGRMLLGPAISLVTFTYQEIRQVTLGSAMNWGIHLVGALILLLAMRSFSGFPIGLYLICCYAGYSLLMLRTFLEHQAHEDEDAKTVIIEDKGLFSLLFLNNNFHAVHHLYPQVAWYKLPGFFDAKREQFLALNQGYYFKSYLEVFKQFAFTRKEPVAYPMEIMKKDQGLSGS